jgi:hypothetical protein
MLNLAIHKVIKGLKGLIPCPSLSYTAWTRHCSIYGVNKACSFGKRKIGYHLGKLEVVRLLRGIPASYRTLCFIRVYKKFYPWDLLTVSFTRSTASSFLSL